MDTLADNPPEEGFEEFIEEKKIIVQKFLSQSNGNFKPSLA